MNWFAASAGCVVLVVAVGCHSTVTAPASHLDYGRERAAIEVRAALIFTNAVLLKPRETIPATDLAFTLAPLLIQEVAGAVPKTNSGPMTVYYQLGAVHLSGITHAQMTYLWSCGEERQLERGVRLTLDSHGFPVIWEVLDDRAGPRVVFVSRSLEESAKSAFGPPSPGRRFAIEQPLSVAPDAIVPRVIEDGSVAMGPIVHLTAKSCQISAVICRCMPPQACQLVATTYYELKPLSVVTNVDLEILEKNRRMVEKLRRPPNF